MGCTVSATTKYCTVDQVNRSVQTSPLLTSAGVISEHMEVTTIFQEGYSDNVVAMRNQEVVRKASIDDVKRGQTTPSNGPFRNSRLGI